MREKTEIPGRNKKNVQLNGLTSSKRSWADFGSEGLQAHFEQKANTGFPFLHLAVT